MNAKTELPSLQCPSCQYLIPGNICAAMVDTTDHGIHAETYSGYKPKGNTMNATPETITINGGSE